MTDKTATLAQEQRAVSYAYDCLAHKYRTNRQLKEPGWDITDAAAGTSFIPDVAPEIKLDDDLVGEALVIKRVDVADDETGGCQTYYVGRRLVRKPNGDAFVISWNARAAKAWMVARQDRPGEVLLRRSLRCNGRVVKDYRDEIWATAAQTSSRVVPAPKSARATEGAADPIDEGLSDFLLQDLARARDGKMRDIVETIQRDQFLLVSDERRGILAIQGGPGTGKSAVGLHRVSWLLYNDVFKAQDVLVVGPHQGFLDYVSRVLPRLDTHGVTTMAIGRLWGHARGLDTSRVRVVKSDIRMAAVLRNAVDNMVNREALITELRDGGLDVGYGGVLLRLQANLIGALLRGDEAGAPYAVRRRRFIDRLVDHLMDLYLRARPAHKSDVKLRKRLEKRPKVASLVKAIWPQFSAEALLQYLLTNNSILHAAADGILSDEEQQSIIRSAAARLSDEPWSNEDLVCLEELRFLIAGNVPQRYRHVVVDEAQDLTPMQARALARRCPSESMTILGDLAQATGPHQYATWQELAELLSEQNGWHLEELTAGYRVPHEVMDFAAPLAAAVCANIAFPRPVRPRSDNDPVRIIESTRSRLISDACAQALRLCGTDGEKPRSIALIVPDDPTIVEAVRDELLSAPGHSPEEVQAIHTLIPLDAKGLEFDHIVILEPAAIAEQEPSGLRQLYVAITRCTQSLTVLHTTPLPPILRPPSGQHAGEPTTTHHLKAEIFDESAAEVSRNSGLSIDALNTSATGPNDSPGIAPHDHGADRARLRAEAKEAERRRLEAKRRRRDERATASTLEAWSAIGVDASRVNDVRTLLEVFYRVSENLAPSAEPCRAAIRHGLDSAPGPDIPAATARLLTFFTPQAALDYLLRFAEIGLYTLPAGVRARAKILAAESFPDRKAPGAHLAYGGGPAWESYLLALEVLEGRSPHSRRSLVRCAPLELVDDYLDRPAPERGELDWRERENASERLYLRARIEPEGLSDQEVTALGWNDELRRRRFLSGECLPDSTDDAYALLNVAADGDLEALEKLTGTLPARQAALASDLLEAEGPDTFSAPVLNDRGLWPIFYELWGIPEQVIDPARSHYHTWLAFARAYELLLDRDFDAASSQLDALMTVTPDSAFSMEAINLRAYVAVVEADIGKARTLLAQIASHPAALANIEWLDDRMRRTLNERGPAENPYICLGVDHSAPREVWRKAWAGLRHRFHDDIDELSVIGDAKDLIVDLEASGSSGFGKVFVIPLDSTCFDLPSAVPRSLVPDAQPYPRRTSNGSPQLLEPYRKKAIEELLEAFADQH